MKILPIEKFEIETTMQIPAILAVLDTAVEPPKWKWFRPWFVEGKVFEGQYSGDGFKIMQILKWRNSFQPVIMGTFCPSSSGTKIQVTMRLHRFAAAFMCVWMGFALSGLVKFREIVGPIVMVVFGVALVSISFWAEVKKAKPQIYKIFSADQ